MAKGKKKKNRIVPAIIITLLGAIALVALVFVGRVLKLRSRAQEIAADVTDETFKQTQASIIYDTNGNEISSLSGIKELYYLEGSQIPDVIKEGFVQIEDQDFYTHSGVDLKAIIRAAIMDISTVSYVQGGSTITQQLAKNMFLTSDKTMNRKITEIFLAVELEKKFSKAQILEFYLNNIYFANGYYGIEAAAEGYFGKDVNELSVSQMAFLIGIPNNPNRYDPVENFDAAIDRRNSVLMQLYAAGIITSLEYYTAIETDIVLENSEEDRYNFVETYVFKCATEALMEADGFTLRYEFEDDEDKADYNDLYDTYYKQYQSALFTGGYRIYTSIDMEKQELLQQCVDSELSDFTEVGDDGIYEMQASAVCIDNSTGLVVAIVGGRDQDYDGYTLNRAFQSYRQPGSAIKPILDYAPYFEAGHTPEDILDDSPWPTGPSNIGGVYYGLITAKEALGHSCNTCAWKILEELTPSVGMSYLHKMLFAKIDMDDDVQATSIGGFTYGVTAVELASGYATLENDGVFRKPTCISHILDSSGATIVTQPSDETTVYTQTAARMVTKSLEYGVDTGMISNAKVSTAIVAAKTGSTNDNKDGWAVGYSRYYTTAVWVGMDLPETVEDLYGGTYPMYIWNRYMTEIHSGLTKLEFPGYEDTDETETDEDGQTVEEATTGHPGWQGGGSLNYEDGDFNHDVDVDSRGDQDVELPY